MLKLNTTFIALVSGNSSTFPPKNTSMSHLVKCRRGFTYRFCRVYKSLILQHISIYINIYTYISRLSYKIIRSCYYVKSIYFDKSKTTPHPKKTDSKQNTKLSKFSVEKKWKLTVEIKFLCPY